VHHQFRFDSSNPALLSDVNRYFESFTVVDDLKSGADSLTLNLSNFAAVPDAGTVVSVFAGYDKLHLLGSFATDKCRAGLGSNTLSISAKAVQATKDMKIKHKKRVFSSLKLSGMVSKIAKENGYQSKFSGMDVFIDHEYQANETDLGFLMRLARDNGLYFSLKNETVIFTDSPSDVFVVDLKELDLGNSTIETTGTEFKSVRVTYFDKEAGTEKAVIAGSGSPQYNGKSGYPSQRRAQGAAKKTLQDLQKLSTGNISIVKGRPEIYAGAKIKLTGVREFFAREYFAAKITHTCTPTTFSTSIEIN
jgi:hypothetical protein